MANNIFAVHYTYNPERSEDLHKIRPDHRIFLRELYDAGHLLASGPYNGGSEALIIVCADNAESALELLSLDPLYQADVIADRHATHWNPVIGPWAE